jgi:hypothetical protein
MAITDESGYVLFNATTGPAVIQIERPVGFLPCPNSRPIVELPVGILAIPVLLLAGVPSRAQGTPAELNRPVFPATNQEGPDDPQELEAFLDGFFAGQMEKLHIPGVVFVLVKDGESFLAFFVLVFLSAGIVNFSPSGKLFPEECLARWLGGLVSGLNLMFLAGLALALSKFDLWEFVHGVPPVVVALLCIPLLTTGLTVGLPIWAVLAWKNRYWSPIARLHYSLIALTALLFIPFLLHWNLLGFHF